LRISNLEKIWGDPDPRIYELRSPQILCPNLIEFGQVVVSEHLWDSPDQIKVGLPNCLSGQVNLINAYSQQPVRIVSNSDKEFEGILIQNLWVCMHLKSWYMSLRSYFNLRVRGFEFKSM